MAVIKYKNEKFNIRATVEDNKIYFNIDDLKIMLGVFDISLANKRHIFADTLVNGEIRKMAYIEYDSYKEIYKDGLHPLKEEFDGWIKTKVLNDIRKDFSSKFYNIENTPIKVIVERIQILESEVKNLTELVEMIIDEKHITKYPLKKSSKKYYKKSSKINIEAIKQLSKTKGVSVRLLGRMLGLSESYVSNAFVRGVMPDENIKKLANLLDVKVSDISELEE